jgi:hypothetical protein
MDKIKLKQEFLQSNLEYEEDLLKSFESEIDNFQEYLEFILTNKIDELSITRRVINVEADEDYCPSEYYNSGREGGTYRYNKEEPIFSDGGYLNKEESLRKNHQWIEWCIRYENTSYPDFFSIRITPFVFNFVSNKGYNNDNYETDGLNIFSDKFWNRWNSEIQKYVIEKKKVKAKNMMEYSYKILGIEREYRLKEILG